MHHRRYQAMLEGKDGLDDPHRPGGGLGVAHTALGRSDRARVPVAAVDLCQAAEFDRITNRRSGAVRLDHANGIGVDAGDSQRRSVGRDLGVGRGGRDVVGASVLVGCRAAQHGKDSIAVAHGIGKPLEHQHGAALGADKPIGGGIEGAATAGRREHALRGCRAEHIRFEHEHAATRQSKVTLTPVQTATGHMHRKQTRRTGRIHRHGWTAQAQGIGHPTGSHAERGSRERVGITQRAGIVGDKCVVVMTHPDEHPGQRAAQRHRWHAGMLDGFP
ncbi:hypothetical protein MSS2_01491 [Mycobacterium marinum]|nr:hypothetical protein MSS2_01491 [Mycobacterium marinum]RFZ65282.1 hypothetical protein DE4576_03457 [Mycobacterium marinum]